MVPFQTEQSQTEQKGLKGTSRESQTEKLTDFLKEVCVNSETTVEANGRLSSF